MVNDRMVTTAGTLARMGFRDAEATVKSLQRLGPAADELVHLIAAAADADQAAAYLADLAESASDGEALLQAVCEDEGFAMRLLLVLGASSALGDHLRRHPDQWRELTDPALGSTRTPAFVLRASMLRAVGAKSRVRSRVR